MRKTNFITSLYMFLPLSPSTCWLAFQANIIHHFIVLFSSSSPLPQPLPSSPHIPPPLYSLSATPSSPYFQGRDSSHRSPFQFVHLKLQIPCWVIVLSLSLSDQSKVLPFDSSSPKRVLHQWIYTVKSNALYELFFSRCTLIFLLYPPSPQLQAQTKDLLSPSK